MRLLSGIWQSNTHKMSQRPGARRRVLPVERHLRRAAFPRLPRRITVQQYKLAPITANNPFKQARGIVCAATLSYPRHAVRSNLGMGAVRVAAFTGRQQCMISPVFLRAIALD